MWKKIIFRNYFLAAVVVDLLAALSVILLKSYLPPLVPLFYGRPAGEAQLTNTFSLLIVPGVSLLVTIINLLLGFWVRDVFQKKILAVSALVITILAAITVVKIVLLVGFF